MKNPWLFSDDMEQESRPPKKPRTNWLTGIYEAHEAMYGKGSFKPLASRFAKCWSEIVEHIGSERAGQVWAYSQRDPVCRPFRTPRICRGPLDGL